MTRQFVRILQLHSAYPAARVQEAVGEALQWQTSSYEAVKHLLLRQTGGAPHAPLPSDLMPGITDRPVVSPDLSCYDSLLAGGAR